MYEIFFQDAQEPILTTSAADTQLEFKPNETAQKGFNF